MREHLVRLTKRGNSRGVNLPIGVIRAMGWEVDSFIQVLITEDGVLLVRPELQRPKGIIAGKQRRGRSE